ncbi:craniofacial development protein 2-like [Montipora foliosa]|uniref:craniofacial development protein 2-like n=1 Tax=Montipora foliosa TaxID=591990 RepID=UPI0035F1E6EC
MIEPPTDGTERILKLHLSTVEGHVNIICVYAPTLLATVETKDHFYESLDTALSTIPASKHIYVIGDFNARNKACHKVSWRHPRSKHWHQLDLVVTRRDSINSVCNTRAYHSADCDTDHSLIASKVKLKPKKLHHTKQKGQPRINTSNTANSQKNDNFIVRLEETLTNRKEENAEDR